MSSSDFGNCYRGQRRSPRCQDLLLPGGPKQGLWAGAFEKVPAGRAGELPAGLTGPAWSGVRGPRGPASPGHRDWEWGAGGPGPELPPGE